MKIVTLLFLITPVPLFAQSEVGNSSISEIVVSGNGENDLRLKKDEINRVGTLKAKDLEKKRPQTFSQLVDDERGIDSQTACAFCGAKRITINGLKGEHTTILVDGLPLHSTVSSFYGVEAIPLGGIDSIDVYRGAGAALTAPESIGGAINIVTREIVTSGAEFQMTGSQLGQKNLSVLGTRRINADTGFLLGAQIGEITPLDLDHNRVTETPRQRTGSVLGKITHKLNATDEVSFRLSSANLKTIGGTMTELQLTDPVPAIVQSDSFEDQDVRRMYLGDEAGITDNVSLHRLEAALIYRNQLDSDSSLKLSFGGARQDQKSIYSHGYDYDNKDDLWVALTEYQRTLGDNHLLTVGADTKRQRMDSTSRALYTLKNLPQDDLTYESTGIFVQDTWFLNESNEVSVVLRADRLKTTWLDLDRVLDKSVLAPRLFYKHLHDDHYTSRLSYGVGYRAPLTLFESMHGTDHNGFVIDIRDLETAHSLVYSLAGQWQDDFFEVGVHATRLSKMAYGVDRVVTGDATLFRNDDATHTLTTWDANYGRRITPNWTVEGLAEIFESPAAYKEKLPVAAIEKRFSLTSNYEAGSWTAFQKLIVIGERNLSAYGYDRHFNKYDSDFLSPTYTQGLEPKFRKAPTFFTLDLGAEKRLNETFTLGFSVQNIFDYTQIKAGDSPTTWHLHGNDHHLDNFHLWGPLRGREVFVNLKGVY